MSSARLRDAAREALQALGSGGSIDGEVLRASIEVELDGGSELVALRLADGAVRWSCSCGEPRCRHARAALRLLAGGGEAAAQERRSEPSAPAQSSPDVRVVEPRARAERADAEGLAAALCDVVTAVARVGVEAGEAASVRDSLRPLFEVAPQPLPLGISRWVGRLKLALVASDPGALARVLHGASQLATDLRMEAPDVGARRRLAAWLGVLAGQAGSLDRVSDRAMVEVAREWVDGVEMGAIERRYLVELRSGEVFLEERLRSGPSASLGPCPRSLQVGLAEVEPGTSPRRLHLLQYAASPEVSAHTWEQVGSWAIRDWTTLLARYRDELAQAPGLAEPFVVVAPELLEVDAATADVVDREGRRLRLDGGPLPAVLDQLQALCPELPPAWIAGRLVDADGILRLRPMAVARVVGGQVVHSVL